jgi:hypothetical protein
LSSYCRSQHSSFAIQYLQIILKVSHLGCIKCTYVFQVIDSLASNVRSKISGVQPTSPLRNIANEMSIPNSPVHMEPTAPVPGGKEWLVAKPVPEKNGCRFDSPETSGTVSSHLDCSQEDQEVLEIVRQGEHWSIDTQPKQAVRM